MIASQPRVLKIGMAIVLTHLLVVVLGALDVDVSGWGAFGRALGFYGHLSGSSSGYAFFAPGVSAQYRVQFSVSDKQGNEHPAHLWAASNGEANLRFGDIIDQFPIGAEDGDGTEPDERVALTRSLAASLAGAMFGQHPEAQAVRVQLEEFLPVDMADYRGGARPGWHQLYQAKFVANRTATISGRGAP